MELFRLNKKLTSWVTVYIGLKKSWISPQQVIEYCEKQFIKYRDQDYVDLVVTSDSSRFDFIQLIKSLCERDEGVLLKVNEDSSSEELPLLHIKYYKFWMLEKLLQIINCSGSLENKLERVALLYADFDYPEEWREFIYYQINEPYDVLMDRVKKYIDKELKEI